MSFTATVSSNAIRPPKLFGLTASGPTRIEYQSASVESNYNEKCSEAKKAYKAHACASIVHDVDKHTNLRKR